MSLKPGKPVMKSVDAIAGSVAYSGRGKGSELKSCLLKLITGRYGPGKTSLTELRSSDGEFFKYVICISCSPMTTRMIGTISSQTKPVQSLL